MSCWGIDMLFQSSLKGENGSLDFSINTSMNYAKARKNYAMHVRYNKLTVMEAMNRFDLLGDSNKRIRCFAFPCGTFTMQGRKYDLVAIGREYWQICLFKSYADGIMLCHYVSEVFQDQLNNHLVFDIFGEDPDHAFSLSYTALIQNYIDGFIDVMDFPIYLRRKETIEESAMVFLENY